MASTTASRAPFGLQQKAVGAHQSNKAQDLKSLPSQDSKTNKPKVVVNPDHSAEPCIMTVGLPIEDVESKRSSTNLNESSYTLSGNSDSKISSSRSEQVSTTVDLDVHETTSSLETTVDQEKKTSDLGSVKNSSVSAKISASSLPKTSGSAKVSDRVDFVESGKSSMCRGSTGTDVSDESSCSSFSSSVNKPHKANDTRWEAIQAVRTRDGVLGLSHFRLLKRLGCGDIGSVYLAELSGTKCYFAMKVMDKSSLASRKKLLRAQTEREILQSLDHPFLPTLYSHFETDKFSCLVMEFCPGGDLHTLRQRQAGKYFSEQAVK